MFIDLSKPLLFDQIPSNEFEDKVLDFINYWESDSKNVSVQTSGSTGIPKVFEIEKTRMLASAQKTCDFLNLKAGDSALLCLPIEYISGKMMVVRSILRKLQLYVVAPSLHPLENIDSGIDFCAMTPLQVENSLEKLHLIKKLIIGGAAVSESLKDKIKEKLPSTINQQPSTFYETYGMSETLSHIGLRQIFPIEEEFFTIFDGIHISKDERNCLKIYAPDLNSEILQTNDLVEIINENQFKFLGRIDNVINSGGAKIFPEQLEALVKQRISNELVFIGVPDEQLGQKLVLVIEMRDTRYETRDHLNHQLSTINYQQKFHKPKEIIFVDEIPRTPNNKVNRLELLKLISDNN